MNGLKRVLIVENDPYTRRALQIMLEMEGYEVLEAEHGEAALVQIAQTIPDVILLDMRMPVMDGWAFAKAYRRTPGPHAPIIVLTAAADAARDTAELGAWGFVPKPFGVLDLLNAIQRCQEP